MVRKSIVFIVLVLCFGLVIFGCSTKKQAVKPSSEQAAASAADKEKARLEAEQKAGARDAIAASTKILANLLAEKSISYDELIFSL